MPKGVPNHGGSQFLLQGDQAEARLDWRGGGRNSSATIIYIFKYNEQLKTEYTFSNAAREIRDMNVSYS